MTTIKDPPNQHADPTGPDNSRSVSDTAAVTNVGPIQDPLDGAASQTLKLTVDHPFNGICLITADGELDMCTALWFEACLFQHLDTNPDHLIVNLQPVSFLGSSGLNSLLRARERAQTTHTQLHIAGLITRVVARPLQVSQLLEIFNTYPTATEALATISDSTQN